MNWNILHVSETKEMKVVSSLTSKGIDCLSFVNVNTVIEDSYGRLQPRVLFPSFVFVNIEDGEWQKIRENRYVIGLVHWKWNPITIPDEYISALKSFTMRKQNIHLEKLNMSNISNEKVQTHSTGASVELILPLLGCKLIAKSDEQSSSLRTTILKKIEISIN